MYTPACSAGISSAIAVRSYTQCQCQSCDLALVYPAWSRHPYLACSFYVCAIPSSHLWLASDGQCGFSFKLPTWYLQLHHASHSNDNFSYANSIGMACVDLSPREQDPRNHCARCPRQGLRPALDCRCSRPRQWTQSCCAWRSRAAPGPKPMWPLVPNPATCYSCMGTLVGLLTIQHCAKLRLALRASFSLVQSLLPPFLSDLYSYLVKITTVVNSSFEHIETFCKALV